MTEVTEPEALADEDTCHMILGAACVYLLFLLNTYTNFISFIKTCTFPSLKLTEAVIVY